MTTPIKVVLETYRIIFLQNLALALAASISQHIYKTSLIILIIKIKKIKYKGLKLIFTLKFLIHKIAAKSLQQSLGIRGQKVDGLSRASFRKIKKENLPELSLLQGKFGLEFSFDHIIFY